MKVLYDSQIFGMQKFGGISRYFYQLCKYSGSDNSYHISGLYSENGYALELSQMKEFPIKGNFRGKGRIMRSLNRHDDKIQLNTLEYDIFHPTYYFDFTKYNVKKPIVLTAHDFIHEIYSDYFRPTDKTKKMKSLALNKADKIIAISNNTRDDLLKYYPNINESKIEVVYHGIEWTVREKKELVFDLNKPYILFTGGRDGYKNFQLFLEACGPLLIKNEILLVCTGNKFTPAEIALIQSLGIENKCIQIYASEEELRNLYENAICFVFPSLYEGFGFPILEAFVSRCPVLASNTSCFPEIAGDAAVFFGPNDVGDMREKIKMVLESKSLRDSMINKGLKRSGRFTIGGMVGGTYNVYNDISYMGGGGCIP